jgi:hypothetical protein
MSIELTEAQARAIQEKLYDHTGCRVPSTVVEEGNEMWALIDLLNEKLGDQSAGIDEYNHIEYSELYSWMGGE